MKKERKVRRLLAVILAMAMITQNAWSIMADVSQENLDMRSGEYTAEQSAPSQDQLDVRAGEEPADSGQDAQPESGQETESETGAESQENLPNYTEGEASENSGLMADDGQVQAPANVSAAITQQIYQQEINGVIYNYVQMTAQVTNNDGENDASGVAVKVLLPEQLAYVSADYETPGMSGFNNPAEVSNYVSQGYDLNDVPQDVINAHSNGNVIMWLNQTIGAGQTAYYSFGAEIDQGITSTAGLDSAWYVNGSAYSASWYNAELLIPAVTPDATPEVTPEEIPSTTPEEIPEETPEVTPDEIPEENPSTTPEVTPEVMPDETPSATPEATPEVTPEVSPEVTQEVTPVESEENPGDDEEVIDVEIQQEKDKSKQLEMNRLLKQRGIDVEKSNLDSSLLDLSPNGNGYEITYPVELTEFVSNVTIYTSNGEVYDPKKDVFPSNGRASFTMEISENDNLNTDNTIHQIKPGETYHYVLPTELIKNIKVENGIIKDKNDASIEWGTYSIYTDEDTGRLALDITFYNRIGTPENNGSPLNTTTTITFTAQFDKDKIKTDNPQTIDFGNGVTVNVTFGKSQTITATKTAGVFDPEIGDNGGFQFQIQMNVDEEVKNQIRITDTLGYNLEQIYNLKVSTVNADGSLTELSSANVTTDLSSKGFTLTFPNGLKKGDYIISYETQIKDGAIEESNGNLIPLLFNEAFIKNGDEEIKLEHKVNFSYLMLDKEGNQNPGTREVNWSLKVNESAQIDVSGKIVQDKLVTSGMYYNLNSPVKLYKVGDSGKELWKELDWNADIKLNSNQDSWSYTMPEDAGTYSYIFEYSTIAVKDGTFINMSSIGKAQDSASVTITTETGNGNGITKQAIGKDNVTDAAGNKYVKWKSTITVNSKGSDTDVIYKDILIGNHTFVTPLELSSGGNDTPEATDGNFYKKVYVSGFNDLTKKITSTEKNFEINFGEFAESDKDYVITLIYYSRIDGTGNLENIGQAIINNTGYADMDSQVVTSYGIVKTGKYNSDGTIDWTIFIESGTGAWTSFSDTYDATYQEILTNTFTISKGSQLLESDVYLRDIRDNRNGNLSFSAYLSDKNSSYTITYRAKLRNINNNAMHGNITIENTIQGDGIGTNTGIVTIPSNVFEKNLIQEATPDKTGKYIAKFELKINENSIDLSGGDGQYKDYYIEDKAGDSVKILEDTIQVVYGKDNATVPKDTGEGSGVDKTKPYYTYSIEGKVLKLTIFNGNPQYFKLRYDAQIVPKTPGVEEEVTYDNTASFHIANVTVSDESSSKVTIEQDSSASTEAKYNWFKVKKVDRFNNLIVLPGATFAIYEGSYKSYNDVKNVIPVATGITNQENGVNGINKGETYFGQINDTTSNGMLLSGRTYTIFETQAPEGYELDQTPHYVTVPNRKSTVDLPSGSQWVSSGDTISVQDTPITSLKAEKVWNDQDNADGNRPQKISISLVKDVNGSSTVVDTVELSEAAGWTMEWKNLATKEWSGGKACDVTYSIKETGQYVGYAATITGGYNEQNKSYQYTITNTYTRSKKRITVKKQWNDSQNQDGYRPSEITVTLKRTYKSSDGEMVTEIVPESELKEVSAVQKLRPSATDKNNTGQVWPEYTWEDLKARINGNDIVYSVEESIDYPINTPESQKYIPSDPAVSDDGSGNIIITLTNSISTEKISVTANKEWKDDNENEDGNRPTSITFELWKQVNGGQPTIVQGKNKTITVNDYGSWPTCKWENLPKKENGQIVQYMVKEQAVTYYDATYSEDLDATDNFIFTVYNSYKRPETKVQIVKQWNDSDNNDGTRPSAIKVTVKEKKANGSLEDAVFLKNGQEPTITLHAGADGSWDADDAVKTYKWNSLLKVRGGKEVQYTVVEEAVPGAGDLQGYDSTLTKSYNEEQNTFELTLENTKIPETTDVNVQKEWNDSNNQDGVRSNILSIELQLKKSVNSDKSSSENVGNAIILQADKAVSDWTQSWNNLPKYQSGKLVYYWVEETVNYNVDGDERVYGSPRYNPAIVNGNDNNRVIIVANDYIPQKTSIKVRKVWEDSGNQDKARPEKVKVALYGTDKVNPLREKELSETNEWHWQWNDLPVYENGKKISYTLREVDSDNELSRNGYTVKVQNETVGEDIDAYSFIVTNTREKDTIKIEAEKEWEDDDNREAMRPDFIEVQLKVNGTPVKEVVSSDGVTHDGKVRLDASNNWHYSWGNLDKNLNGSLITYEVDEVNVPAGYSKTIRKTESKSAVSYAIVNTHETEKTFRNVRKIWNDANNQDNLRVSEIDVQLYQDGIPVDSVKNTNGEEQPGIVKLNADNHWSGGWENLNVYKNVDGKKVLIDYTVEEITSVKDYETDISYTEIVNQETVNLYTLTNSHIPYITDLSVWKDWDDGENVKELRPSKIEVVLKADGVQVGAPVVLDESNHWNYKWEKLPVNRKIENPEQDEFHRIVYTIEETTQFADETYTVKYNYLSNIIDPDQEMREPLPALNPSDESWSTCIITNYLDTGKTRVLLMKYWNDNDDEARPEEATFQLFRQIWDNELEGYSEDLERVGEPVTIKGPKKQNMWMYTWKDLDRVMNEHEIIYSVKEIDVPEGYTSIITGQDNIFTAINIVTHVEISKKSITGTEELPGAQLELYAVDAQGNQAGSPMEKWTSTEKPYVLRGILEPGKSYLLKETAAPNGYTLAEDVVFTVLSDGTVQNVTMYDKPTEVTVSKKAISGKDEIELEDAVLQILDEEGNVAKDLYGHDAQWTTSKDAHKVTGLPAGTYTLHELTAPKGYYLAPDMEFTLTDKGELLVGEETMASGLTMYDYPTKVEISKKDLSGKEELPGAQLALYLIEKTESTEDNSGIVETQRLIERWTSGNTPHIVTGLIIGQKYALKELEAPEGYSYAEEIQFTVEEPTEGAEAAAFAQKITMLDGQNNIYVSKRGITGTDELPGATLQILTDAQSVVEEWTSGTTPHSVGDKLEAGKEYILHEVMAPAGYLLANDIIFAVNKDGTVTVKGEGDENTQNSHVIVMRDQPRKVEILKVDSTGKPLADARLQILYPDGKVVEEWTSEAKAHELKAPLKAGTAYKLHEVQPPAGYLAAEDVEFTVDEITETKTVTMTDQPTQVTVSKKAITGEDSLGGAVLQIVDKNDKVVAGPWTTEEGKDKTYEGVLSVNEKYTLQEVTPPNYYGKAANVDFMLNDKGKVIIGGQEADKVVMRDAKTRVRVSKTDITGEEELEGAILQIIDKETNVVVEEWTTADKPHYVEGKLIVGKTYILHEKFAPEGYAYAKDMEFVVKEDSVQGNEMKVTMWDAKNVVQISKTDLSGTKELPGAKLQLLDESGTKVLESWTSTNEPYKVTYKVEAGKKYILRETEAPAGYALAEDQVFTVNSDGTTTEVVMKDAPTGVTISKTDLTGNTELAGAVLQILTQNGKEIERWTTDGKPHTLQGKLDADITYVLHEVSAPDGYWMAEDIEFKVDSTGKPTTVTMKDAPTKVSILKVDESGKALAGAQLAVKDAAGNEIARWTSSGSAHVLEKVLKAGETYTLTELSAPAGYQVAADVKFTVSKEQSEIQVTMKDFPETGKKGKISVTKRVTLADGLNLIDLIVKDATFYVGLFRDSEGTQPYGSVKALKLENASSGIVTFDDLPSGTYYVFETDSAGTPVPYDEIHEDAKGKLFMCTTDDTDNVVELNVKAQDVEEKVNLNNIYYDIPDGAAYRAYIDLNKQVIKGGSETTVDDTFYAGIYTKDEDGIYNLYKVAELTQNGTVTVEVGLGGEQGMDPITYYVFESDEAGNPVDLDVFEYEVSGEGKVTLSTEHDRDTVSIVNTLPEESQSAKLTVQKIDGNGMALTGAEFQITNEEGTVVEQWTSEASAYIMELTPGEYTLSELKAPAGYKGGSDVAITVDEENNITVDSTVDVTFKGNVLKYVNKPIQSVTPTPAPTGNSGPAPQTPSSPTSLNTINPKGKSVKTGDETPVGMYLALLAAAALLAGTVTVKRKKQK